MGTVGNGCGWEYLQRTKMIHNENWYIGFCKKNWGLGRERKQLHMNDIPQSSNIQTLEHNAT